MKQTYFFIILGFLLSGCGIDEVNSRGYVISHSHKEIPIEAEKPPLHEAISH
jgi:uncharacterized protein YcfL